MLTLLRAVGHVLDKVDGNTSKAHRFVIDAKWIEANAGKPACQPQILWGFIEQERNNLLKQHEFALRGSLIMEIPPTRPAWMPVGTNYDVETKFDLWSLIAGPFKGEKPFTVVQRAIDFWREYLDIVEAEVADAQTM